MAIRVNGVLIPEQAVLAELKRLIDYYAQHLSRAELGQQMDVLVKRAKEHAVGTRLLLDEVKRRHVDVADADVDAALAAMVKKAGGDTAFAALLDKQRLSRDQLRASIRAGKQLDQLIARLTSNEPEPTDDELKSYYEEHPERYAAPDQVQLRHILIKPAGDSEQDRAACRSRLEGLKRQLEEGDDFAELAATYSECPSGKEAGGSLGWVPRGTTVPEFDRVVFDMEVGEISTAAETALGMHLVEKLDEDQGEPLPFAQVRERIRDLLVHERRGKAITRFVEKLRQVAVIDEDDEDQQEPDLDQLLEPDGPSSQGA